MKVKKVSRKSRWKVFVKYQRCDEALTRFKGMDRSGTNESPLDFPLTLGILIGE